MIVGRFFGWLFALAAVAALARDIVAWIDTGSLVLLPLGQLWFEIDNGSLNLIQAITQRYIFPALWDPVIVTILLWPAWLVLAIPAIVLLLIFRRRRN